MWVFECVCARVRVVCFVLECQSVVCKYVSLFARVCGHVSVLCVVMCEGVCARVRVFFLFECVTVFD